MKSSLIIALFSLVGCIQSSSVHTNNPEQKVVERFVTIDSTFGGVERISVENAFNVWEQTFKGVKWNFVDNVNDSCSQKKLIVTRSISTDQVIINIETSIKKGILGYHLKSKDPCSPDIIYIVVDKIDSPEKIKGVAVHELGHVLGLKHNHDYSIMNITYVGKITEPTVYDLENLLKLTNG